VDWMLVAQDRWTS